MTNTNVDDDLIQTEEQQLLLGGEGLRVSSLEDMMRHIFPEKREASNVPTMPFFWMDKPYYYRGQADNSWGLVPTLYRDTHESDPKRLCQFEKDVYKEFTNQARAYLPTSLDRKNPWELLFIAQHYGVPTRLLDWSGNFLAATYFAVAEHPESDGAVWCIRGHQFKMRETHPEIEGIKLRYPPFDALPFNTSFFGESTKGEAYFALVIPPHIENRIRNQSGAFTVHVSFSQPSTPDELVSDHGAFLQEHFPYILLKFIIAADAKAKIKKKLESMGVDWKQLFPDLSGLGKHFEDKRRLLFR